MSDVAYQGPNETAPPPPPATDTPPDVLTRQIESPIEGGTD